MVNFSLRPSFISSLVLVLLLFVVFSHATKVVEVPVICNQTENPPFCTNFLNSIPGGATGKDLVSIAQYTIDVVRENITNSIKLIKSLISQNASDPKKKKHYQLCLDIFEETARDDLEETQESLKMRNYFDLNTAAGAIAFSVDLCITNASMTPGDPPYQDSSLLPKYADVIEKVIDITLVISNILLEK
ncbi:hypothetical protein RIF29_24328 [Crotalaria pallida]|uniref:Pectinesterase inhibitor domain-containing protein n=1 Tax=Crotalaria pallida TaxID=3830 RepID=A0AAN9HYS8_CROPI